MFSEGLERGGIDNVPYESHRQLPELIIQFFCALFVLLRSHSKR
jgi:hypothetical protein